MHLIELKPLCTRNRVVVGGGGGGSSNELSIVFYAQYHMPGCKFSDFSLISGFHSDTASNYF